MLLFEVSLALEAMADTNRAFIDSLIRGVLTIIAAWNW
jgi:hypothetical protein